MLKDSGPIIIVGDNNLEVLPVKRSFDNLDLNRKIGYINNGLGQLNISNSELVLRLFY